jgi:sugar O-acyltransferase (sialic acid O-acetyltransferase NeuD family)
MRKTTKLVLFGVEDFADIAYEYFTWDSAYEVVAFTVDRAYLETGKDRKFGLPVVAFEDIVSAFPPDDHAFFAAVVYADLNRLRERICGRARQQGYRLASYVSSRAFVWPNAALGEHCFIFENNSVQPFTCIGDNVVLWCGNQISHHARIGDHCFLSGSVAVGGWANVGDHCFVGLNATLANNTDLGAGSWISHGAVLSGAIPPASFVTAGSSDFTALDQARLAAALKRASQARKRRGVPAIDPAIDRADFPCD